MRRALAVLSSVLAATSAKAVEEPKFQRLEQWGNCELRAFPALTVAETTVAAGRSAAGSTGFRLLAGYIFGGNSSGEKIAMTAPVLETPDGGGWAIRFNMPAGSTLAALPKPNDAKVRMRAVPPAKFAVIGFSGWASDADFSDKSRELLACVAAHGLKPVGTPALAQYDPPWTLGPWRRNEAMVEVE